MELERFRKFLSYFSRNARSRSQHDQRLLQLEPLRWERLLSSLAKGWEHRQNTRMQIQHRTVAFARLPELSRQKAWLPVIRKRAIYWRQTITRHSPPRRISQTNVLISQKGHQYQGKEISFYRFAFSVKRIPGKARQVPRWLAHKRFHRPLSPDWVFQYRLQ
jgi:hypothetical protein